jgi:galactose mutarotase-like enzyme
MHIIISQHSIVKINPFGAELKSFNINGNEIIWQSDPKIWSRSAPILFPFVGRLKDQKYIYNGKEYEIAKHGFAKMNTFTVEKQQRDSISLVLKSTLPLRKNYPFKFLLRVIFSLNNDILSVSYEVENNDEHTMFFSIGSHPGISLPLDDTELGDYYIEFENNETLFSYKLVDELLVQRKQAYLNNEKIINLSEHVFDDDVIIFTDIKSRNIYIKNDKNNRNIKVNIQDTPDLGIWAKPGAGFVCIEPWHGYDDTVDSTGMLEEKPGIIKLAPGNVFKTGYSIEALS